MLPSIWGFVFTRICMRVVCRCICICTRLGVEVAPAPPHPRREALVTARSRRLRAHTWIYGPAVCGPIGGGLIKMGGGSTLAAVVVGVAPYAVCLPLLGAF